jgi:hypothetical membrane protein
MAVYIMEPFVAGNGVICSRIDAEGKMTTGPEWAAAAERVPRPILRILAWCGVVPLVLDVAVVAGVAALHDDYSHARDYLSELGEHGRPYGGLLSAWWVAWGLLLAPFALPLHAALRPHPLAAWPPLLLAAWALLAGVGSGVFRCDPGCAGETFSGRMHYWVGDAALVALIPCPIVLGLVIGRRPEWRGFRASSIATSLTGVAVLGLLAWSVYGRCDLAAALKPYAGLTQRLFTAIFYAWIGAVAVRVARFVTPPRSPAGGTLHGSRGRQSS